MAALDIYSALERGVVDGAAWPGLDITDLGFEKFIAYRVNPHVWQFDNLLLVSLDRWNTLTDRTHRLESRFTRRCRGRG